MGIIHTILVYTNHKIDGLSPNEYQELGGDKTQTELQKLGSNDKGRITVFKMPVNYPRFKKSDYETMPDWKLDCLLSEYGLAFNGDVNEKRKFAMGAFLWPSQI